MGLISRVSSRTYRDSVMLRKVLKPSFTSFSKRAASSIITDIHPDNDEIAIVKMNAPPINALSRPFLHELEQAIDKLEKDEDIRAMVLTANKPGIFSAGLDIFEMYGKDRESLGAFWTQLQNTWLKLYKSPLMTVAAINGTSPAGGCLLSISCDYRIMADHKKFQIGLNETKLGLVAPPWFAKPFVSCIGEREAEKAEQFLEVPDFARIGTKQSITRKDTIEWFDTIRESDVKVFQDIVSNKKVQQALGMYVQMLKAKSK